MTMKLDGPQAKQFAAALLSGFPRRPELEQLLYFELDVGLDMITSNGGLLSQIIEVLAWAESHGRLQDLVRGAVARRPQNPDVVQLAADFEMWRAKAASAPAALAEVVNVPKLRGVLTEAFTVEELQLLCADVEQMLRDRGIPLKLDLETVGGSSKPAQALNLIQHLQRRGHLSALVSAVRHARPGAMLTSPRF